MLPVYVAATVFVPTVPKATWHVATPAFRVCVPPVHVMLFPPLVNETVPVGVPLPGGLGAAETHGGQPLAELVDELLHLRRHLPSC